MAVLDVSAEAASEAASTEAASIARMSWHIHGISDTALAAVLTHCKKTPVEENCGTHRRTIYRAIEDSYSKVASKIQLPLKDGTVWDWRIARLDKMLQILCAESSKFRFVITMALKNANDGSVLEMISYLDEVIPGNALKPDNGRKTWAIYITCKDLPQWMLQLEDCWLCVAVIRTGIASEIDGNVPPNHRDFLPDILFVRKMEFAC